MTTELIAAIISILLAGSALLKQLADNYKIRNERMATKAERDDDSQQIHDTLLKHDFMISQLKDNQALTATVVDDLRDTCATLNTSIAKLDIGVANLTDAVKELKK